MSLIEEHINLTNEIMAGNLTKKQVVDEINKIESKYGESAFGSYQVTKKSAPWSKSDLEDLKVQSASGACSKEFYLYMAEVSEYVHRESAKKGLIEKASRIIAKNWLWILFAIAGLFIVIACLTKILG